MCEEQLELLTPIATHPTEWDPQSVSIPLNISLDACFVPKSTGWDVHNFVLLRIYVCMNIGVCLCVCVCMCVCVSVCAYGVCVCVCVWCVCVHVHASICLLVRVQVGMYAHFSMQMQLMLQFVCCAVLKLWLLSMHNRFKSH